MNIDENYNLPVEMIDEIVKSIKNHEGGLEDLADIPETSNKGIYASFYKDINVINAGVNNRYKIKSNGLGDVPQVILALSGSNNSFEIEGDGAVIVTYGGEGNKFKGAVVCSYDLLKCNNFDKAYLRPSRSLPSYASSSINGLKSISPRGASKDLALGQY